MGSSVSSITSGLGLVNSLTGGAIPFLNMAGQVVNTVSAFRSDDAAQDRQAQYCAEQDQALAQLQQQQALQEQQAAQNAALDKQKIATALAQSEEERRAALRRAVLASVQALAAKVSAVALARPRLCCSGCSWKVMRSAPSVNN